MYNLNLAQAAISWLLYWLPLFTSIMSWVNCSRDIFSWCRHMGLFLFLPTLKPKDFNSGFGSTFAEKLLKLLCTQLLLVHSANPLRNVSVPKIFVWLTPSPLPHFHGQAAHKTLSFATVVKRVPILGTGSLKGPFWIFGSLLGPYLYFRVPIFNVLAKFIQRMSIQSSCTYNIDCD